MSRSQCAACRTTAVLCRTFFLRWRNKCAALKSVVQNKMGLFSPYISEKKKKKIAYVREFYFSFGVRFAVVENHCTGPFFYQLISVR